MADTDLILRNDSGLVQVWGGQEVANAATYPIQEEDRFRLLDDDRFRTDLTPADAVVTNGIFDLSEIVALKALRQDRLVEEFTLNKTGTVSLGSFFQFRALPTTIQQFVVPFTGYFSSALVTSLSTTTFTIGILVNDVEVDTIIYPSSGSPQGSHFEPLTLVVQQDDAVTVRLNAGSTEDPAVQLTLQDF